MAERLRQLIVDATLQPGTWLNEPNLCDTLKVSRPASVATLTVEQLHWLFDGIDIEAVRRHPDPGCP